MMIPSSEYTPLVGVTYTHLTDGMGAILRQRRSITATAFHLPGLHNQKSHGREYLTDSFDVPEPGDNARYDARSPDVWGRDVTFLAERITDPETAARIQNMNEHFMERYGRGIYSVEHVITRYKTPAAMKNKIAYFRGGEHLGINPKLLWDGLLQGQVNKGYHPPGTGTVEATLTHEWGHVILHNEYIHGNKMRDAALRAAWDGALAAGMPGAWMPSIYAKKNLHEREAEMFAFYHHGGRARPEFVKEWGETLHYELGLDPTPLSEDFKR